MVRAPLTLRFVNKRCFLRAACRFPTTFRTGGFQPRAVPAGVPVGVGVVSFGSSTSAVQSCWMFYSRG
ncbi:MAG: hypothetical protein KC931_25115, partial [Candidatus Omnitrophica bacterium]|nr:hypothetical protein [Candidatus Omnitrophota bacterium]